MLRESWRSRYKFTELVCPGRTLQSKLKLKLFVFAFMKIYTLIVFAHADLSPRNKIAYECIHVRLWVIKMRILLVSVHKYLKYPLESRTHENIAPI